MAEYIEKEAAINTILGLYTKVDDDGYVWILRGNAVKAIDDCPAADVRENDELDELINEAVLTLNNIYIGCRIKEDDYVRLLNDICAIRGAQMGGAEDE